MLPAALIATVRKRLGMFVLRSKVTIEDVSGATVRLGIGGPSRRRRRAATAFGADAGARTASCSHYGGVA